MFSPLVLNMPLHMMLKFGPPVEIERVVVPELIMVSFKLMQILFVFWQKFHFQHTFWSNFTATQSLTLSQYCMKPE